MPGDYFWQCVEALAATFDGDRAVTDESLNIYEQHARAFSPEKLVEVRRQLVQIVGGLSRLEMRLGEL